MDTANAPVLDIVIPAREAGRTIADAINSLLAQTETRWRAIVVEDGCPQRCADAAPRDPRVAVRRTPGVGAAQARNIGFAETSAPLVYFLDADDIATPSLVARAAAALGPPTSQPPGHPAPAVGWVAPTVCTDERLAPLAPPTLPSPRDLSREALLRGNQTPLNALLFRREALSTLADQGHGPFRPGCRLEDWDLLLHLASRDHDRHRWASLPGAPIAAYRFGPPSVTTSLTDSPEHGRELLHRHGADAEHLRRHAAGWLARAIVWSPADRIEELSPHADALRTTDDETAAHAAANLRWAVLRDARVHTEALDDELRRRRPELERRFRTLGLDTAPLEHPASRAPDWDALLRRARREAADPDTIAVYGLGVNGRAALRAARAAGLRPLIADDDPNAAETELAEPIDPRELGPGHTVVVTPHAHEAILDRLRTQGVERILRPGA